MAASEARLREEYDAYQDELSGYGLPAGRGGELEGVQLTCCLLQDGLGRLASASLLDITTCAGLPIPEGCVPAWL